MSSYPLTEANMGLAHAAVDKLILKFSPKDIDRDDLLQVAWAAMIRMEKTYDKTKGTFTTHVYLAVQRDLVEHLRRANGVPVPRSTSHLHGIPMFVPVLFLQDFSPDNRVDEHSDDQALAIFGYKTESHYSCTDRIDAVKALKTLEYDEMRVFVAQSQGYGEPWMVRHLKMSQHFIRKHLASAREKIKAWRDSQ